MNWPAEALTADPGDARSLRIACDEQGCLPAIDPTGWDVCLTRALHPPRPWVHAADPGTEAARLYAIAAAQPQATRVLLDLLRRETATQDVATTLESLAFSVLLGSDGFRAWLARRGPAAPLAEPSEPVRYARKYDTVTLTLASPIAQNAYSAHLRDALCEALDSCLIDPTNPTVLIASAARAFCTGGALWEFGTAGDLTEAHAIRMERSAALRLLALGKSASVLVNGAAIGSGIEIAAAAHHIIATPRAWFSLPELGMGLIPGAGGTFTIPRRIGRHRTTWMVLSGRRIAAPIARDWGLIDAVLPA